MAGAALELFPPAIRGSLLNDQSFREEYGFKIKAMIALGPSGVSVQRSVLFDTVRAVLAGEGPKELTDAENRTWNLVIDACKGTPDQLMF